MTEPEQQPDENEISLRGRLADAPEWRELPSGDRLATFRLTVRRPPGERVTVDSIDCASTRSRVHKVLSRADPGDVIELNGALRRRFWRANGGLQSRYTVDVAAARRVPPIRSGPRAVASAARTRASG